MLFCIVCFCIAWDCAVSNCPELWWRYGRVFEMLGDEVTAENARAASISLGSGEGGATF